MQDGEASVDDNGLVSCTGDVRLAQDLHMLPVKFHHVAGYFDCSNNALLTSLQGSPKTVGKWFNCSIVPELKSLEGAPETVGIDFDCSYNASLESLKGLGRVNGGLNITYQRTLPLLRCLQAKYVTFDPILPNHPVERILNKYAGKGRREMFWCQKELEDAGFPENARW